MAKGTTKETLKALTDEELITEAKLLHQSIYVIECYGAQDIFLLKFMYTELERRGYKINEKKYMYLVITKK